MAEELRNVSVQQMDMKCPRCNQGYMRPNGLIVPGHSPEFTHVCTQCAYTQNYPVRYPHVIG
jgi:transposase-like protein